MSGARPPGPASFDVAIVGGGIAGMATAARLQAAGLRTVVLEAHGLPGGCAGYFRRSGFSFDVGATTLVDFGPGGIGGQLLDAVGAGPLVGEQLPGYVAWLPDRTAVLHRDTALWSEERLRVFGDSPAHRALWRLFDRIAEVFWRASRRGVKLPIRSLPDGLRAVRSVGVWNLPLARYLDWTVQDALCAHGLQGDRPLRGLLSMLLEDTVHATLEKAPLINAVLGSTIRAAGLTRARGGMFGFWRTVTQRYRALGGVLRVGTTVQAVRRHPEGFTLSTRRGELRARSVVSSLTAGVTARIGPPEVAEALAPFLRRDAASLGGAIAVFLGVPEEEVAGQPFTHHQLLQNYEAPLGEGNNMFISVSAEDDLDSAPAGHRAVMLSTHCELAGWQALPSEAAYQARKEAAGARLLGYARRVYPHLGRAARVHQVATPRTYERYTRRPLGAVGGVRLNLQNANQHAIPHDVGVRDFWLCGDSTWPGLGTVACVLGSRIVAEGVLAAHGSAAPAVRRTAGGVLADAAR